MEDLNRSEDDEIDSIEEEIEDEEVATTQPVTGPPERTTPFGTIEMSPFSNKRKAFTLLSVRPMKKAGRDVAILSYVVGPHMSAIYIASGLPVTCTNQLLLPPPKVLIPAGPVLSAPPGQEKPSAEPEFRDLVSKALTTGAIRFDDCLAGKLVFDTTVPWGVVKDAKEKAQHNGISMSFAMFGRLLSPSLSASGEVDTPFIPGAARDVFMKCFFQPLSLAADNSLICELQIYRQVVAPLIDRGCTPHLVYPVAELECGDFGKRLQDVEDTTLRQELKSARALLVRRADKTRSFIISKYGRQDPIFRQFSGYNWDDLHILMMERRNGHALKDLIGCKKDVQALSAEDLRAVLFQVFWTIGVCNQVGLVHQDLHFGNILVEQNTLRESHQWYTIPSSSSSTSSGGGTTFRVPCSAMAFLVDWDQSTMRGDKGPAYSTVFPPNDGAAPIQILNTKIQHYLCQFGLCNQWHAKVDPFYILWLLRRYWFQGAVTKELNEFVLWCMRGDKEEMLDTKWKWLGRLCKVKPEPKKKRRPAKAIHKARGLKWTLKCDGAAEELKDEYMRPTLEILAQAPYFQKFRWVGPPSFRTGRKQTVWTMPIAYATEVAPTTSSSSISTSSSAPVWIGTDFVTQSECVKSFTLSSSPLGKGSSGKVYGACPTGTSTGTGSCAYVAKVVPLDIPIETGDCVYGEPKTYRDCMDNTTAYFLKEVEMTKKMASLGVGPKVLADWTCEVDFPRYFAAFPDKAGKKVTVGFIVMEKLDISLKELPEDTYLANRVDIFAQLRHLVQLIANAGYVHNDIHPGNVMLKGKQVYLIDFGDLEPGPQKKSEQRMLRALGHVQDERDGIEEEMSE